MTVIVYVRHAKFVTDDIAVMTLSVHVLKRCSFLRVDDSE